jgi:hypothetical protein
MLTELLPNAQTYTKPQPWLVFYWGKSQVIEVQELAQLLMKMTRQICRKALTVRTKRSE